MFSMGWSNSVSYFSTTLFVILRTLFDKFRFILLGFFPMNLLLYNCLGIGLITLNLLCDDYLLVVLEKFLSHIAITPI